jgi:cytochrome c553
MAATTSSTLHLDNGFNTKDYSKQHTAMRPNRQIKLISVFVAAAFFIGYSSRAADSTSQEDHRQMAQQAVAILQTRCLQCHGADKASGLDLRTREGVLNGGSRGAAIKPGDGAESLLYRFISGKDKPRMPLGEELAEYQIELLKQWIDKGAIWPTDLTVVTTSAGYASSKPITDEQRNYWAFRKPARPPVPAVKNQSWIRTPIDAFVLAKLEEKGLQPSPRADKRTLIRRVTFDLTGLPPAPEEINAFIADRSPDAYRKVVKRLLSSPRYGERWAQHWLDVVRFGETNGFELDAEREQSWRYRDYVVKSLNEDKPYDRSIVEQIAGDELAPDDFEMRVATGFLRAGPQHVVSGNQDLAVNRQEWLTEVMFGVGNGIMGLTVGCARCHDHKFDPIPQADFYRLQAFFAAAGNYDFKRPAKEQEQVYDAAVKAHKEKLKPILDQIAAIEKPYREKLAAQKRAKLEPQYADALAKDAKLRNEEEKRLAKDAQRMLNISWDELVASLSTEDREKRAALRRQMHNIELYAPEPLPKALAVADVLNPVPPMHLLKGGDPHRLGTEVEPGFLSVLLPKDAPRNVEIIPVRQGEFKSTGRKLALARWLTQRDHPLTARVMMNRLWHHHFGRGIVATPNDFGRNGQQPTHPELLDWLAVEFVDRGWSLKQMHEVMVLSNAYQQSSAIDSAKAKIDPDNKLLWRMNRQRLDAEAVRDAVLAVSSALTEQMGGPSIRVPLEPEVYDIIFTEQEPDNLWPAHPDPRQHTRRSLYLIRKRNVRLPLLVAFDAPDMMSSCGARAVSVHALQSLTLMNSEFMLQQSRRLAERLFKEANGNERAMIARLYELALARKPQIAEVRLTQSFLKDQTAIIRGRIARGEHVVKFDELPKSIDAAIAAAWVDLCLATLNLNEFVYLN